MWWDWKTPFNGTVQHNEKVFNLMSPILDGARAYFSARIHIDQSDSFRSVKGRPVMLCCHPHGILGYAVLSNFGISGGIILVNSPIHVLTLDTHFCIPLWRDFCLAMGVASVGRNSIKNLLNAGKDIAVVLGGARESLDATPGNMILSIKKRKGFFRIALQEGAAIVPVVSFGETELFKQIHHPTLRRVQESLLSWLSFALPVFWGRFGIFPAPIPLTSVVGAPLIIEKTVSYPSREDIEKLQELYVERIVDLHKRYNHLSPLVSSTLTIK